MTTTIRIGDIDFEVDYSVNADELTLDNISIDGSEDLYDCLNEKTLSELKEKAWEHYDNNEKFEE